MSRSYAAFPIVVALAAAAPRAETLTILHTNDFHSRIEPINQYNSTCPPKDEAAGKCFGGSARLPPPSGMPARRRTTRSWSTGATSSKDEPYRPATERRIEVE